MKQSFAAAKPGSGGGALQNAKAQSKVAQSYGKSSAKHPAKKPGTSGDNPASRKGSPLAKKK